MRFLYLRNNAGKRKVEMKEDNFEKYILLGIEERISVPKQIEIGILVILISLPLIVIERHNYLFLLLCLFPTLLYLIFVITVGKGKPIKGVQYILYNGIFSVSFSWELGLIGIDILLHLFSGKERNIIICVVSVGYVLMFILYGYIIKNQINKKDDYDIKNTNKGISFILFGVLGGAVARTFLNDISNRKAWEILCILCFFLSYLTLIGIFNIYKYRYLKNHQEILLKYQNQCTIQN